MKRKLKFIRSTLAIILILSALAKILHLQFGLGYLFQIAMLAFSITEISQYFLIKETKNAIDGFNLATGLFVAELVLIDMITGSNVFVYALPIMAVGFLLSAFTEHKRSKIASKLNIESK